jgi:D-glycero-D-manno-heptose 1,7-bisphosphate phosphatase
MRTRAVFLDRDGVINPYVFNPEFGTVDSPARACEFSLLQGAGAAINRFNQLGLQVVVISNQPGIAKRKFTLSHLNAITAKMRASVESAGGKIDAIYYCRHHPDSLLPFYRKNCECRKPKPGLLLMAANDCNIDIARSYTVGDGVTDVLAGSAAGTTTIFVSARKCYICDELARHRARPDFIVRDLWEASEVIYYLETGNLPAAEKYSFSSGCFSAELP